MSPYDCSVNRYKVDPLKHVENQADQTRQLLRTLADQVDMISKTVEQQLTRLETIELQVIEFEKRLTELESRNELDPYPFLQS